MLRFGDLLAWRKCHELTLAVYRVRTSWPVAERYGLTAQLRGAVVSAASNIAEGSARRGGKEFRRFLDIALGSLAETEWLLRIARDLGMLPENDWRALEELRSNAGGLTWRLARSLDGANLKGGKGGEGGEGGQT